MIEERKVLSVLDMSDKADLVDGKVPIEELPSYVDDVVEYDTFDEFPNPGEGGKIYIALDTGYVYRWSGSMYIQIGGEGGIYYTKGEIDEMLDLKLDKADALTPEEVEEIWRNS